MRDFGTEAYYGAKDYLYAQAVELVTKEQRVSQSGIQRKFKIGYNRAVCLIEAMEEEGLISKPDGRGHRAVINERN